MLVLLVCGPHFVTTVRDQVSESHGPQAKSNKLGFFLFSPQATIGFSFE